MFSGKICNNTTPPNFPGVINTPADRNSGAGFGYKRTGLPINKLRLYRNETKKILLPL